MKNLGDLSFSRLGDLNYSGSVWPDGKIIFQYLATHSNENLPNTIKFLPKEFQNYAQF